MRFPRVFVSGSELSVTDARPTCGDFADVLIVCGQGVYEDGTYHGEFHDRDVYFEHAVRFPEIATKFNFNTVVLSGGFTQKRAPWLSEAESFLSILRDANVCPPSVPVILDECALDSAENLLLGLMTVRLALGNVPIRRVGIWAAWKFKKWRFNRNAEALGIVQRTYVYSLASSSDTNIRVNPEEQNQRTIDEYRQDSLEFSLLREPACEKKRQNRWQNNRTDSARDQSIGALPRGNTGYQSSVDADGTLEKKYKGHTCSRYCNRLQPFECFSAIWVALKQIEEHLGGHDLPTAWAKEVMSPQNEAPIKGVKQKRGSGLL